MYLTLDGGGTKLVAACFDENFRVLSRGRSGGVNLTQNTPEGVRQHVAECLEQVLGDRHDIDQVYAVFVGPWEVLEEGIYARCPNAKITYFAECTAGLLAGAGARTGLLALSGTGSDVFHISKDRTDVVGGWGPVVGDQGSGTWIGLMAVRAVVKEINGWGEKTLLTPLLRKHFDAEKDPWNIVTKVHETRAPFTVVSRVVPVVAQAAREGDAIALDIFQKAGEAIGEQMAALLRRVKEPYEKVITLCGGAWKAHPAMLDSFRAYMKNIDPAFVVNRPWFEHMVAGAMEVALNRGLEPLEARKILSETFQNEILSNE